MNYKVIPIEKFKKESKRLIKKYPSLKSELLDLADEIATDPFKGTELGHHTFKIRLAIKSKGKGKSGGARIITYCVTENREVYLLTIYDKTEIDTISDKLISRIIETIHTK